MLRNKDMICKNCSQSFEKYFNSKGLCKECKKKREQDEISLGNLTNTTLEGYKYYIKNISSELSEYLHYHPLAYRDLENHWNEIIHKYSASEVDLDSIQSMKKRNYRNLTQEEAISFARSIRGFMRYSYDAGFLFSHDYQILLDAEDVFAIAYTVYNKEKRFDDEVYTCSCMFFSSDPYLPIFISRIETNNIQLFFSRCCHNLKTPPFEIKNINSNMELLLQNTQAMTKEEILRLAEEVQSGYFFGQEGTYKAIYVDIEQQIRQHGYFCIGRGITEIDEALMIFLSRDISSNNPAIRFWANINQQVDNLESITNEDNQSKDVLTKQNMTDNEINQTENESKRIEKETERLVIDFNKYEKKIKRTRVITYIQLGMLALGLLISNNVMIIASIILAWISYIVAGCFGRAFRGLFTVSEDPDSSFIAEIFRDNWFEDSDGGIMDFFLALVFKLVPIMFYLVIKFGIFVIKFLLKSTFPIIFLKIYDNE